MKIKIETNSIYYLLIYVKNKNILFLVLEIIENYFLTLHVSLISRKKWYNWFTKRNNNQLFLKVSKEKTKAEQTMNNTL